MKALEYTVIEQHSVPGTLCFKEYEVAGPFYTREEAEAEAGCWCSEEDFFGERSASTPKVQFLVREQEA